MVTPLAREHLALRRLQVGVPRERHDFDDARARSDRTCPAALVRAATEWDLLGSGASGERDLRQTGGSTRPSLMIRRAEQIAAARHTTTATIEASFGTEEARVLCGGQVPAAPEGNVHRAEVIAG